MDVQQAKEFLESRGVKTVLAAGVDQIGTLRGKRMPVSYFLSIADRGLRFAWFLLNTGSVDTPVEGILDNGVPDVIGMPDLATLRMIPWEEDAAFVFMDWRWNDGSPCELCPRTLLKSQIERLRQEMGADPIFALELEFILLDTPVTAIRQGGWNDIKLFSEDKHCYALYEGSFYERVVGPLRAYFENEIEGCTPEWGEGQFEANLRKASALEMADTTALFKLATKQVAAREGVTATFMAKLREGLSGNSGHIHHSLTSAADGRNMCFDPAEPDLMDPRFRSYVAGMYDLMRETTLFFAPYVNSYKRFELDSFAGVTKSWGVDNRTVAFRFINSDEKACRIENRIGGADLNPYTAMAVTMASGLWGVRGRRPLVPAMEGNCYHIEGIQRVPNSLADAVPLAAGCAPLREILPKRFIDNVVAIARQELTVFEETVTDLERRRYLEMS